MNSKNLFALIFIFFIHFGILSGQAVISASGDDLSGEGGTISFTLGQTSYILKDAASGSTAEGVQQPYEIWEITGLGGISTDEIKISVFPNPTTNFITLQIEDPDFKTFHYKLYDLQGRLKLMKKITEKVVEIDMTSYLPSVYFLHITSSQNETLVYKIIKY